MIKTLFSQLEASSSSVNELSSEEKKTLNKLYKSISQMPCSEDPLGVEKIQKYKAILSNFLSIIQERSPLPLVTSASDPLLNAWKKAPSKTPEKIAFTLIHKYIQKVQKGSSPPPLDLSNLGLKKLPACLFTDPIFADADIAGNKCEEFPEGLTVGAVRNIKIYKKIAQQVSKGQSRKVLTNKELLGETISHLTPHEQAATRAVNTDFKAGRNTLSLNKLKHYRDHYYQNLPTEIQAELDALLSKDSASGSDKSEVASQLEVKIQKVVKRLHDRSLVKAFHQIIKILPREARHSFIRPPKGSSTEVKAAAMRAFLKIHQEALAQQGFLELSDLNLKVIPPEIKLFSNLKILRLNNNNLSDISALTSLSQLNTLELSHNNLSDISPIRSLKEMITLRLGDNDISDISPLEGLVHVRRISLNENNISDPSPLKGLTKVRQLDLYNNNVSNIFALKELTKMRYCDLSSNKIYDVSPLLDLESPVSLGLLGNNISNSDKSKLQAKYPNTAVLL